MKYLCGENRESVSLGWAATCTCVIYPIQPWLAIYGKWLDYSDSIAKLHCHQDVHLYLCVKANWHSHSWDVCCILMHLVCLCVCVNVCTGVITGQGQWVLFVEDPVWKNGTVPDSTHPISLLQSSRGESGREWQRMQGEESMFSFFLHQQLVLIFYMTKHGNA